MSMLNLIQKLTEATEPSRELDAEIWKFLPPNGGDRSNPYDAPRFTRSVDAARLLLRKHYLWELKQGIQCRAVVWWLEKDWDNAPTAYTTEYPAMALATATLIAMAIEDRVREPA